MRDLYNDPGHGRLKHLLDQRPAAVDFIKAAEFEDDRNEVPKTAFAWPSKNLFPIHSPEHAVVSYLYAKTAADYGEKVPREVFTKVCEALDFYGVDLALLEPEATKEASIEHALFDDGSYPVRTSQEIKLAEQKLLEQLPQMHPETRATLFSKLAARAQELGTELSPKSYKLAGLTLTNAAELVKQLEYRYAASKEASSKNGYAKLASAIVSGGKRELKDRGVRIKLAEAIGTLDEKAGLVGQYDRKLPDPITTVFNTSKLAFGQAMDVGGVHVSAAEASMLPPTFYSDVLGKDVLAEIAPGGQVEPDRLHAVVQTLPSDIKTMLGKSMLHAGVGHAG